MQDHQQGGYVIGSGHQSDVWRLPAAGSTLQNPSHTYTRPGTYPVTLQACNADGCSSERKAAYITVIGTSSYDTYLPLILRNSP